MNFLNLRQIVPYGGSFQEEWDNDYRLTVHYENRHEITLDYVNGQWKPVGAPLPDTPLAECFFQQAASAALAAQRFVASGQTAQNVSALTPDNCRGAIFAAECMRRLMDDYGLRMESVYPYVSECMGSGAEFPDLAALYELQPRTHHVLQLLTELLHSTPPVRHDIRLPEYRNPFGAVSTGQKVCLSIRTAEHVFREVITELYGDSFSVEIPMKPVENGWRTEFQAPSEAAALWYRFRLTDHDRVRWLCSAPDGIHSRLCDSAEEGFRFTVSENGFETPAWFQHSILYQIFPDRFAFSNDGTAERGIAYHTRLGQTPELHQNRSEEVRWKPRPFEENYIPDDFYGGTLRGIRQKLPYLKEFGISCLYLNPIFESRSNHRYDTSDYLRVDPILGSNEDFQSLCSAAEQLGIKIILDGVFSHTGADSIYFNRDGHYPNPGACQPVPSPYDTWYDFQHFPDEYRSWWGFRELPEVDEHDAAWQQYIITGKNSVLRQWLRDGASGWRLDVADELPDDVLSLIRQSAREEKRDALILGEVWEDAVLKESYGARRRYALGTALDSVMNYPFRTAVLNFLHGRITAFELADFLTAQQLHYPEPLYRSLMNLLGSHDVERLRTALATAKELKNMPREEQLALEAGLSDEDWQRADSLERLAAAIQFSIPGVPSIYYGDEIGMTGTNDPFNRRPMEEDDKNTANPLSEYVREWAQFRNRHNTMQEGKAFFLAADSDVLLILRSQSERILTVVNRAEEVRHYEIFLPDCQAEGSVGPCQAIRRILTV